MTNEDCIIALAALAQQTRLETFKLLVSSEPEGMAAGMIAETLVVPHNTLSTHLSILSRAQLVSAKRYSRSVVYRANLSQFQSLIGFLLQDCCGGNAELCVPFLDKILECCPSKEFKMSDKIYNVLFLCTGNSARSILAEGILRKDGANRFRAYSAGSQPKGTVNPLALNVLNSYGYPTDGFHSKSWDEFAAPDAPELDFVFTVCDSAAGEACPYFPGQPMTAHWGIPDPATVEGTDLEKEAAFVTAFNQMRNRISVFTALPMKSLDAVALKHELHTIGQIDAATQNSIKTH